MKYLIQILFVIIFPLLSCAGRRQLPPVEVRGEEGITQQETQPDTVVVVDTTFVQITPSDTTDENEWDIVEGRVFSGELHEQPTATTEPRQVPGYRVQIFASIARDKAEEFVARARHGFTEKVYLEFEEPYYKVRIGNFTTREDAEILRRKAISLGFKGSWIVGTIIEQ